MLTGQGGDDTFLVTSAGGHDTIVGGAGVDTIRLDAGGAEWKVDLQKGSVTGAGDGFMELSKNARGSITFGDGSTVDFKGIERIEWGP